MADEIRLEVISTANSKGLTDTAREMRSLRSEANQLTGTLGTLEDGSFSLDKAIEETHGEVVRLRQEFAKTGDTTLFGDLRRQQATLSNLHKIKEAIEDVTEATAEMGGAVAQISGGGAQVGSTFGGRMGPAIITGLITGLLPHLPTLGAILAGAVAGTIGTGGVIGGIVMASNDPRVRMAAQATGAAIQSEFFSGSEVFVEPTIRSLRELQMAFNDMELPETFAKMAPHITTIAKGLGDLGRNIMPGLNKAFDRMAPFTDAAAEGFGQLGGALGQFMDDVTSSEGTVEGLSTLFKVLSGAIIVTGKGLNILSDAFTVFNNVVGGVAQVAEGLAIFSGNDDLFRFWNNVRSQIQDAGSHAAAATPLLMAVGEGARYAAGGTQTFGEAAGLAQLATGTLNAALSDTHSHFLAFASSEIAAEDALDDFAESVRENGRTLDIDTEKGRENVAGLIRIAETARQAAADKFEETRSVKEASAVYDTYRQKLYDQAIALGYSSTKAQELVDKYLALAALPDITKKVTLQYRVTGTNQIPNSFGAGFFAGEGRAAGGPVMAGVPYVINERGYETVTFPASGTVHPANLTPMTGAAMGRPLEIFGGGLGQLVFDWLRGEVANRGGKLAVLGLKA